MERRKFLALLGSTACTELARRMGLQSAPANSKADITIRISPVEIEVAPRKLIKTTGYNGSAPGPVLRLREGQPVTVDVFKAGGVVPLVFRKKFAGNRWVDHWTINGKSFPKTDPIRVRANYRYGLRFDNQSDEGHPVHLHRHTFELTKFAGKATAGVMKDVIVVPAKKQVEADFTADNPGPTLFHCHQQLHVDYGFMTMVQYGG